MGNQDQNILNQVVWIKSNCFCLVGWHEEILLWVSSTVNCRFATAAGWNGHILLSHPQDELLSKLQCFFSLPFLTPTVSFLMVRIFLELTKNFAQYFLFSCLAISPYHGRRDLLASSDRVHPYCCYQRWQLGWSSSTLAISKAKEVNTSTFPKSSF